MTRKDYITIAEAVNLSYRLLYANHWQENEKVAGIIALGLVKTALADALAKENPAFDPSRFKDACGGHDSKTPCETCGNLLPCICPA